MKSILCIIPIALTLFLIGCSHIVSKEVRQSANRDLSPSLLFSNPDAYRGQTVILGGTIADVTNEKQGTFIEIVQKPLDSRDRPEQNDVSAGRFLAFSPGYLDPVIYQKGKDITIAGTVLGKRVQKLGEVQYPYTVVRAREIHLIEKTYGRSPLNLGIGVGIGF